MSRAIHLAVIVAVLAGCAQPEAAPTPQPVPELAVEPSVTDQEAAPLIRAAPPTPGASATDAPRASPAPTATPADGDDAPAPEPQPTRTAAGGQPAPIAPVVLLSVGDRASDHGPEGPDWTDLTAVELAELGNDLRVTLQFAGALPSTPAEGEVPLIGVDIGTGDDGYQLFIEGGGQSWEAYLQTPQGFVEYPGTFRLGGRSIVLQVPFNAVGSPTRAPVTVFVEWSRDRLVLNATSQDRLDGEPHTFDRNP